MWIFCCGAKRSGSTLQYNLLAETVELSKIGKRIEYVKPLEFGIVREKYKDYDGYKVFKTHVLTEEIRNEIMHGNAICFYVYRDIRDVIVSFKNKGWLGSIKGAIKQYLDDYNSWMSIEDRLIVRRYEDFYDKLDHELAFISKFLGIELSEQSLNSIVQRLSLATLKNRIGKFEDFTLIDSHRFDPKTLLHEGHINSGEIGQWRRKLLINEILEIEAMAASWLTRNGYDLFWPKSDIFISNSQHGDDYIGWQLLGKATSGLAVEVGAFDGVHLSNSYSLEVLGWQSICIEPNTLVFPHLLKNRPKATNINLAVIDDSNLHLVDFFVEEIGVLSGCAPDIDDIQRRYNNRGLIFKEPARIKVNASTLDQILVHEGVLPGEIDLLSIDVEGFELVVLRGFDLNRYRPKLIIIEANSENDKSKLLDQLSLNGDYIFLGDNRQNLFFIRIDLFDLKKLRKLDFVNFKAADQYHPLNQDFAIQAVTPHFRFSKEIKGRIRPNFFEKIIKRFG
jgi:FkbM family methyltransferase